MKRRDFLHTVGVTAAAGALPVKAIAAPGAAARGYGMSPYAFAKYTARINKRLTPDMLRTFLGFSESEANRMIRRLTFEKVLAVPDANGISQISETYAQRLRPGRQVVKKALDAMREVAAETPPEEAEPSVSDEA